MSDLSKYAKIYANDLMRGLLKEWTNNNALKLQDVLNDILESETASEIVEELKPRRKAKNFTEVYEQHGRLFFSDSIKSFKT